MQKYFYITMMKRVSLFKTQIYCIDTSSIINLFYHYPQDIFQGLWEKLEELISEDKIISHETVLKEIQQGDDEATKWCRKNKKIFKKIDECQETNIKQIRKKYSKSHWEAKIKDNKEWADPWVIALAICEKAIIVSDEANKPDRIPYIANHFRIKTLNLMDFFREIGLKL